MQKWNPLCFSPDSHFKYFVPFNQHGKIRYFEALNFLSPFFDCFWFADVSLLCLGPLTNIALAFRTFGDLAHKVAFLYIMGGNSQAVGNTSSSAEFNFFMDPEAAHIVLSSSRPVTLLPWETCTEPCLSTVSVNTYGLLLEYKMYKMVSFCSSRTGDLMFWVEFQVHKWSCSMQWKPNFTKAVTSGIRATPLSQRRLSIKTSSQLPDASTLQLSCMACIQEARRSSIM